MYFVFIKTLQDPPHHGIAFGGLVILLSVFFGLAMLIATILKRTQQSSPIIEDIEEDDSMTNIVGILATTNRLDDAEIQAKVVAKTNPAWEKELIRLLGTDSFAEVYPFLDTHEVEHKVLFAQSLNRSIYRATDKVRKRIKREEHFIDYQEFRSLNIDRMIGAVDKFKGLGVDFYPAIRAFRAAFDEPFKGEKFNFNTTLALDAWLKKNTQ